MKVKRTIRLEDLRKQNKERREDALKAVRKVDPDFYLGKRAYDKPRKEGKREILIKLAEEEKRIKQLWG